MRLIEGISMKPLAYLTPAVGSQLLRGSMNLNNGQIVKVDRRD